MLFVVVTSNTSTLVYSLVPSRILRSHSTSLITKIFISQFAMISSDLIPSDTDNSMFHNSPMAGNEGSKTSIALIHGGWLPSCRKPAMLSLPLLSHLANAEPAVPDSALDKVAVSAAVLGEVDQGKDVVLVMHSYSTTVGYKAIKGIASNDWLTTHEIRESEGGVAKLLFSAD